MAGAAGMIVASAALTFWFVDVLACWLFGLLTCHNLTLFGALSRLCGTAFHFGTVAPAVASTALACTAPLTQLVVLDDVTSESEDSRLMSFRGGAISIGNFDGVHVGHRGLLRSLRSMADQCDGPAIAVTFDPHPAAVLRPDSGPTPLTSMATRAERMGEVGIDALVVIQTCDELLSLSAHDFYQSLVDARLAAGGMIEGPNFNFGRDRTGNVELLRQWCRRDGRRFEIATATDDGGRMVSSSRIRQLILDGDVRRAAEMMDAPHRIIAPVVHGDARGRTIGFPTANLSPIDVVVPPPGVYAGRTRLDGRDYAAAIHVGPNLTFDQDRSKFEVHVLDFAGDLYQRELAVDVCSRVRDISRFDSAEELKRQLSRDIESVRQTIPV